MKKGMLAGFCAALVLAGLYMALSPQGQALFESITGPSQQIIPDTSGAAHKIDKDRDYVFVKEKTNIISEYSGTDYGETLLPQINLNNPEAIAYNTMLERRYKESVKSAGDSLVRLHYKSYINNDILSFVLNEEYYEGYSLDAVNFSIAANKKLTQEDILRSRGIPSAELKSKLPAAIVACFNNNDYYDNLQDKTEILEKTISDIDFNNLKLYLNETNALTVIVFIDDGAYGQHEPLVIE